MYIYINGKKVCYLSINLYKHLIFNKLQVTNFKKKYVTYPKSMLPHFPNLVIVHL